MHTHAFMLRQIFYIHAAFRLRLRQYTLLQECLHGAMGATAPQISPLIAWYLLHWQLAAPASAGPVPAAQTHLPKLILLPTSKKLCTHLSAEEYMSV